MTFLSFVQLLLNKPTVPIPFMPEYHPTNLLHKSDWQIKTIIHPLIQMHTAEQQICVLTLASQSS